MNRWEPDVNNTDDDQYDKSYSISLDKIIRRFLTGGLAHGAYKNEEACN